MKLSKGDPDLLERWNTFQNCIEFVLLHLSFSALYSIQAEISTGKTESGLALVDVSQSKNVYSDDPKMKRQT